MYCRCFFLIPVIILIICMSWYFTPTYALYNNCALSDLVEDPSAVEDAILKMGPYRNYLITPDGRLLVKERGQWLRLRYEREVS